MPKSSPPISDQSGPLRYASYARVSTAGQAEKELSIPAQQRECRAYVTREGGALVHEFTDARLSGTTMEHPDYLLTQK